MPLKKAERHSINFSSKRTQACTRKIDNGCHGRSHLMAGRRLFLCLRHMVYHPWLMSSIFLRSYSTHTPVKSMLTPPSFKFNEPCHRHLDLECSPGICGLKACSTSVCYWEMVELLRCGVFLRVFQESEQAFQGTRKAPALLVLFGID